MTYHRRNKKKINKKIIAIIVVLLILFFFGPTIKGIVHIVATPVNATKNVLLSPFKNSIEYFKTKDSLIEENEELKNENRRLSIENLTVESLKKENSSLKNIVNYKDRSDDFIVAKVINHAPFSPYDTFVIDIDSDDIEIGQNVYNIGVLIGEVEEVYSGSAVIRLYSSPNKNIFVDLGGQQFEAIGIGGGGFSVSIPKDIEIAAGETIFFNSTPLGKVDEIEDGQSGAFKNIYFRYPFNVNDVEFVQIYRK